MDDDTSRIGERLRRLRKARGLNQEALGKLCEPKAGQTLVSQWEKGDTVPPIVRMVDWGRIFRVPAAYFLGEIELSEEDLKHGAPRPRGEPAVDVDEPTSGVGSYDPDADEEAMPQGLNDLIESGMVMTATELQELKSYSEPGSGREAYKVWTWTAEDWLRVLMETRHEKWKAKLRTQTDET